MSERGETSSTTRKGLNPYFVRRLLAIYAEQNAQKAVEWLCEDCGIWFVVMGDRHPEKCPRCESRTLTAYEGEWSEA